MPGKSPGQRSLEGTGSQRVGHHLATKRQQRREREYSRRQGAFCLNPQFSVLLHDLDHAPGLYSAGSSHNSVVFQGVLRVICWGARFSLVAQFSRVRLLATPWTAACQASLSITNSLSLLKLTSIESVMPSNHLILCRPLLSRLQSFPASGSFPMSQLFTSGGQSTGVHRRSPEAACLFASSLSSVTYHLHRCLCNVLKYEM